VWPECTSFFSHVYIDDGFTEDLSSNKRQTDADYDEDDSEAIISLLQGNQLSDSNHRRSHQDA
jgi:hypothetical protein